MPDITTSELVERLMRSAHRLRRASVKSLAPLGLTPAQERMLRLVSRGQGPWRMGELASRMGIVPRSATSLVDGLERAGLVKRAIDPDNRRSILVILTDHGKQVQRDMSDARAEAGEHLFAHLDERERELLADLLDKVAPPEDGWAVFARIRIRPAHTDPPDGGDFEPHLGISVCADLAPPEAILSGSVLMAVAVMVQAYGRGIRYPDDLWVAGFDDAELSAHLRASLIIIRTDAFAWGQAAAAALNSHLAGEYVLRRASTPGGVDPPGVHRSPTSNLLHRNR
jgi:DNA-binding MarR family transcriptional regulator